MYKINSIEKVIEFETEFEGPITQKISELTEGLLIVKLPDFYEDVVEASNKFASSVHTIIFGHTFEVKPQKKKITIKGCRFNVIISDRIINIIKHFEIVEFDGIFNNSVDFIPFGIKRLLLNKDFNHPINNLPNSLMVLRIDGTDAIFNYPVDNLPEGLKVLHLNSLFDFPVDNLPSGLEKLVLGDNFNHKVENLPPNLKYLSLGNKFNHPIDNLPIKLKYLSIGRNFNKSVDNLPPELEYLSLGNRFRQTIDKLPTGLKFLLLKSKFNRSLDNLPNTLTHLYLGPNYKKTLDRLPESLTHLKIGDGYKKLCKKFPDSLTHLSLGAKSDLCVKSLMPNVECLLLNCYTIKNFDLDKLSPSIKYIGFNLSCIIKINSIPSNIQKLTHNKCINLNGLKNINDIFIKEYKCFEFYSHQIIDEFNVLKWFEYNYVLQ